MSVDGLDGAEPPFWVLPAGGMILHLWGLQEEKMKAEGASVVAVVDLEPLAWFKLCPLTYAESLSLPDMLLGSGHTVAALRGLTTEAVS